MPGQKVLAEINPKPETDSNFPGVKGPERDTRSHLKVQLLNVYKKILNQRIVLKYLNPVNHLFMLIFHPCLEGIGLRA
jgi:hypothetical protein